ncbi:hypothetical protein J1614_003729 [Plenodomus biglobosus]|nr:hypothetical protein J1614_003729 [Plenodomus biglobosus]
MPSIFSQPTPPPSDSEDTPPNFSHPLHLKDFTFEQYKATHLNVTEQHDLIGKLRAEVPLIERDAIDSMLLRSLAQQLELVIFPTARMMHVDPRAVWRMLEDEFRKAYGPLEGKAVEGHSSPQGPRVHEVKRCKYEVER